jgi:chloramphenicol-sensitive protein RarD
MTQQDQDTPRGLALAITAYVLWGFLPLYMKLITHIPAVEIVAHRVIWSIPVAGAVLLIMRRTKDLRDAIRNPRMLLMACVTAALISVNWGIYIYAIATDRTADGALGYYINPLFSMFLAAVLLGEKPSGLQMVSILIAAAAVVVLFVASPASPWIPIGLTFSWGFTPISKSLCPSGPIRGSCWKF